jgi:two-component system, cell cycle sensor histidine kinase and response regulator CckA
MSEDEQTGESAQRLQAAQRSLAELRSGTIHSLPSIFESVTRMVADALCVERVGIWLLDDDRQKLRCVSLFDRARRAHSSGIALSSANVSEFLATLESAPSIPRPSTSAGPFGSILANVCFRPLSVTAILDATIPVRGRLAGVICLEHVQGPREWTAAERDFAGLAAEVVAHRMDAAQQAAVCSESPAAPADADEPLMTRTLREAAAGVAHDFNNILSVVNLQAEMIVLDPASPALSRERALMVLEAGERGVSLAAELMRLARVNRNPLCMIRPAAIIREKMRLLRSAAGKRHQISVQVHDESGWIALSAEQLDRILVNLVVNAREAMPAGGLIRVEVDHVRRQNDVEYPGHYVEISVIDQGVGIAPHLVEKIFDPDFTTKSSPQSHGLGLAVVRQILNQHGGFVRVDSQAGQGTAVRLYFPLAKSS